MKQTVCLLLATLVVFQLCNFIYAAPSGTNDKEPESESDKSGSEASNGGSGLIESNGNTEPSVSNGGSESTGSYSGSSNTGANNSSSSKDPSTGRGPGMLMDQFAAMLNLWNRVKDSLPFTGVLNPQGSWN